MNFIKLNTQDGAPILINLDQVTQIVPWINNPDKYSAIIFSDAKNGATIINQPLYMIQKYLVPKPKQEKKYI